jgi:putative ABC transport system permease protein
MFKYHFKIVWRNLLRFKLHSILNISGFAIGISSFILIMLYVQSELGVDRFQQNRDRIYKLTIGGSFNTMAPLTVILKDKIPEIEKIVRLDFNMGGGKTPLFRFNAGNETKTVQVNDIIYADSTFFDVFSFRVLNGNAKKSLSDPNTIILTKSISRKIFGNIDPVGKTIEYIGTNERPRLYYTVSAIIEDIPENSSIKFNGIVSFITLKDIKPAGVDVDEDYGNWTYDTYILADKSVSSDELTGKINKVWFDEILKKNYIEPGSESSKEYVLGSVPLKEVTFYQNNKIRFIYLIMLVGIIIIIIGIINFVNLSIAKSYQRAKEIGVRKVAGSSRYELIKQFTGESLIIAFISSLTALIIVSFLMPVFNEITGKSISFSIRQYLLNSLYFVSGSILIGIIAGAYPAFYLSALKPLSVFKNVKTGGLKTSPIIQGLIIFQFTISITLIISTITISRQIKYMRTADTGFDKENLITFQLTESIRGKYDIFKKQLLQNPDIISVAGSSGKWLSEQFHISFNEKINESERTFYAMAVDPDFVNTVGLKIVKGRNFSRDMETDKYRTVIINETAVKNFGLDDPLGCEIKMFDYKARVVGVVRDFHNESFQKSLNSLLLWDVPEYCNNVTVRISDKNIRETISFINKQWEALSPDIPFEYNFLEEKYNALYNEEDKFSIVIGYFSIIAILIACLGLFGVVSFSAATRTKEIGIRKINGAKISEILLMLNRNFIILVLIAYIIAIPVAWYFMHKWLGTFAFRTTLSWWIFILSGLLVFLIAVVTVSWQSWRTATRNPVEALRYE